MTISDNKTIRKTSALAVANCLINFSRDDSLPLTHLKLQKLIYFCYAWYAGNTENELFPEDIEAWQYGPVIQDVYNEFKRFGSQEISSKAKTMDWDSFDLVEPEIEDQEIKNFVKAVWDQYKHKSANWLVNATHSSKEPWGIFVRNIGCADKSTIPFDLIRKIYLDKVQGLRGD